MGIRNVEPVQRTARRILYRFQTHDVRMYLFDDAIRRTREAVVRSGGELRSGVMGLPRKIKRWTLLRSPHVHKKSREKFWMVTHLRKYLWDAPAHVDTEAPQHISMNLPPIVAVRVVENSPGLCALKPVFDTIQRAGRANGVMLATDVKAEDIAGNDGQQMASEDISEHTQNNSTLDKTS